jgi:hypothetical protein
MTVSYSYCSYYVANMNRWQLCNGYRDLQKLCPLISLKESSSGTGDGTSCSYSVKEHETNAIYPLSLLMLVLTRITHARDTTSFRAGCTGLDHISFMWVSDL